MSAVRPGGLCCCRGWDTALPGIVVGPLEKTHVRHAQTLDESRTARSGGVPPLPPAGRGRTLSQDTARQPASLLLGLHAGPGTGLPGGAVDAKSRPARIDPRVAAARLPGGDARVRVAVRPGRGGGPGTDAAAGPPGDRGDGAVPGPAVVVPQPTARAGLVGPPGGRAAGGRHAADGLRARRASRTHAERTADRARGAVARVASDRSGRERRVEPTSGLAGVQLRPSHAERR